MLRVDGPRFRLRRRRRLLLWSALALLALIAMLLGLLAPRAVRIEIWPGASAAPTSCPYSGGGAPFKFQSFEAGESRQLYLETLRLAAANQLFPDDQDFQLPVLTVGDDQLEWPDTEIPPQILYAIAWVESKLAQAPYDVDWGTLGRPLLSHDCGYGIMQITSTIINDGGWPSRYEALVGTHFAYNLAAGARILAEKWNDAFFPIVGDHDPSYAESWYYALWAYNGWAGVNHPQHSSKNASRGVYGCDGERWLDFTYPELVLGCLINPPMVQGSPLWVPLDVSLPGPELFAAGAPLDLDVFYAGLDEIYTQIASASPFAEMNMPLPVGAQPLSPTDDLSDQEARTRVLGSPAARIEETELDLTSSQIRSGDVPVMIHNDGTGLLAWRVVDAPNWLSLNVSAGVALGDGYGFEPQPSHLKIAAAVDGVPEGSHRGQIELEFHYPNGTSETHAIAISLDKQGAARYEAGRPQS